MLYIFNFSEMLNHNFYILKIFFNLKTLRYKKRRFHYIILFLGLILNETFYILNNFFYVVI